MADFSQWVVAGSPALGLNEGEFVEAYEANRAAANRTALESSPVVTALRVTLDNRNPPAFEGTATDLLALLSAGRDTRAKGWPKNPRALSGILNRLAPNLRADGIEVEQVGKVWKIAKSQSSQESTRLLGPRAFASG